MVELNRLVVRPLLIRKETPRLIRPKRVFVVEDFDDASLWTNNSSADLEIVDSGLHITLNPADNLDLIMDTPKLTLFETITADVTVTDITSSAAIQLTVTESDGITEHTVTTPDGATGELTLELDVTNADLVDAEISITSTNGVLDAIVHPIRGRLI